LHCGTSAYFSKCDVLGLRNVDVIAQFRCLNEWYVDMNLHRPFINGKERLSLE